MLVQSIQESPQSAHVVVLGNEKGGSGKSTTALSKATAMCKAVVDFPEPPFSLPNTTTCAD